MGGNLFGVLSSTDREEQSAIQEEIQDTARALLVCRDALSKIHNRLMRHEAGQEQERLQQEDSVRRYQQLLPMYLNVEVQCIQRLNSLAEAMQRFSNHCDVVYQR